MHRSLRKGDGTGSPYSDCIVWIKVRIETPDGEILFSHDDPLSTDLSTACAQYDLEQYEVPAAIRKVLKKQKCHEIKQLKCSNSTKLQDHLPDPNGVFKHEWLAKPQLVITVSLLKWQEKDAIFKLPLQGKIERVTFLKNISAKFFAAHKYDKAYKIFDRINHFF